MAERIARQEMPGQAQTVAPSRRVRRRRADQEAGQRQQAGRPLPAASAVTARPVLGET